MEGLDVGLDLLPVLAARQQHARGEGARRSAQPEVLVRVRARVKARVRVRVRARVRAREDLGLGFRLGWG